MSGSNGVAPAATVSKSKALSHHGAFLAILNDPPGRLALFDFLKSGYSEHHLTFWEEVEFRYKPLGSQPAERNTLALELYKRFVKNGSKQQINITEPQRLRLKEAVEKIRHNDTAAAATAPATPAAEGGDGGAPAAVVEKFDEPVDLFDEAAATCLELIKGNYFFLFQQSKQYQAYTAEKKARKEQEKKSSTCTIL